MDFNSASVRSRSNACKRAGQVVSGLIVRMHQASMTKVL